MVLCFYVLQIINGEESRIKTGKTNSDITYVQIKPLINRRKINPAVENFRSSRIEKLPLQIKPSIPKHGTQIKPSQDYLRTPRSRNYTQIWDYVDGDKESEDRFDTSETLVSEESKTYTRKVSPPKKVIKDEFVRKNIPGKKKLFSLKKFYEGNFESVDPIYKKYLETRNFRSKCRCERISNCPKIQISVPRCPEEYFMCCF